MVININKDVEEYKENVFFGMSAKQFLSAVMTVVCGVGLVLFLYPVVGLTVAAYLTVPLVAPIALGGFYSMNGMGYFEIWKRRIHYAFGNRTMTYRSVEEKKKVEEINIREQMEEGK